jgi:hypothetical protein
MPPGVIERRSIFEPNRTTCTDCRGVIVARPKTSTTSLGTLVDERGNDRRTSHTNSMNRPNTTAKLLIIVASIRDDPLAAGRGTLREF